MIVSQFVDVVNFEAEVDKGCLVTGCNTARKHDFITRPIGINKGRIYPYWQGRNLAARIKFGVHPESEVTFGCGCRSSRSMEAIQSKR
jgi:hypothetical protein